MAPDVSAAAGAQATPAMAIMSAAATASRATTRYRWLVRVWRRCKRRIEVSAVIIEIIPASLFDR
jgi:hypothetical protein